MKDQKTRVLIFDVDRDYFAPLQKELNREFRKSISWLKLSSLDDVPQKLKGGQAEILLTHAGINPSGFKRLFDLTQRKSPGLVVLVWADKTARKNYPVGKGFGIENMMVFNTGEFTAAAQIIRLEIEKLAYANLYQASEEKFEQIFNQTPLFSLITGFESGLILAINEAFIQITGFTREELFGHTTEELGLWENPQEIDRIARKLQKEPKIEAIDINYLSRDKENRIFRAAVERIDYLGKEAMLFSGEDVTARVLFERAAERNHGDLTRAQKLPHLGNWTLDLKTDSLHFSEELYQIFGLSHLEGDFQESYYVRIHPNDREFVRNTHANVKQKFKPFDIEFRIITPDGIVWMDSYVI